MSVSFFASDPVILYTLLIGMSLLSLALLAWIAIKLLPQLKSYRQLQLDYRATEAELILTRQGFLDHKSNTAADIERITQAKLDSERALFDAKAEQVRLQSELAHAQKGFEEKLALLRDAKEQMSGEFKLLANEIFESKNRKFGEESKLKLHNVIAPLQENIKRFEKRVEESYNREAKERHSLEREIRNLQDLNQQISSDANNLANALKGDNKAQGNWGELVLESILEKSGLLKGREYEIQLSLKSEDGKRSQPDVVVHLPQQRDIIIDSKVSLKAWEAYCSLPEGDARVSALKQHVQSIRAHIKGLSAKDYQNLTGVNTLDYVFLFMPIEAAYSVAAQHDNELFQFAFERNIVIVVPTTLLTTMRTVQNIWRLVQQNENSQEIARRAGMLYDKFVGFAEDLEEIGNRLDLTQKSYDKAMNKLQRGRGNLVGRVEALKKLGAKTSKVHSSTLLSHQHEDGDEDT